MSTEAEQAHAQFVQRGLGLLRAPFPAHQISKLPKPKSKDAVKGQCNVCGGWHGLPALHLDYVGHAALTDRLLDCDPNWTWEPFTVDERGLPALDGFGGMWIRLTVCGITRIGYGHAGDKSGGDAIKEVIGDALRNAAMRFGAALDLWHKGELHKDEGLEKVLEASIEVEQEKQKRQGVMGATLPAVEDYLDAPTKTALAKLAHELGELFKMPGGQSIAFIRMEREGLNQEEKIYLSSMLDSKLRSALKRERDQRALASAATKETA